MLMRFMSTRARRALQLCVTVLILIQPHAFSASSRALSSRPARHKHSVPQEPASANAPSPKEAERLIAGRARQVILALKAGNIGKLATFVHPQKGVRFSPYASVLPDEDRVVKKNQLAQMWASNTRYKWGAYDGSGDPIRLTFKKYHRRFIFDHDFANAKSVRYNGEVMGHGNTLNNVRAIYPGAIAVEHYFPGFDPKFDGMDWRSLWLVFEKKGNEWYLVGIVHDEWTI